MEILPPLRSSAPWKTNIRTCGGQKGHPSHRRWSAVSASGWPWHPNSVRTQVKVSDFHSSKVFFSERWTCRHVASCAKPNLLLPKDKLYSMWSRFPSKDCLRVKLASSDEKTDPLWKSFATGQSRVHSINTFLTSGFECETIYQPIIEVRLEQNVLWVIPPFKSRLQND